MHYIGKNNRGAVLFEVLLAVLILAVGMTATLQGFSSVVQVTKRSRELFEAQFILSDLYFHLYALPDSFIDLVYDAESTPRAYENDTNEGLDDFMYTFSVADVEPPSTEEEEAGEESEGNETPELSDQADQTYKRLKTNINSPAGQAFSIETFHVVPSEDNIL